MGLLFMQASSVWHGLEHITKATGNASYSFNIQTSDKAQPLSGVCLKCLEDPAHSFGLICEPPQHYGLQLGVVQANTLPACGFTTPVSFANQRGPPALFLS
jgi:hypothetical protein